MVRMILWFMLALVLVACGACTEASGATVCTVKYYYTSPQNPECVPAATTGALTGSRWKIKPAAPSRTVYAKNKNGKTMTYTFDGWYTNINCMGTRYMPGKETTALAPSSTPRGYVIHLYGRWLYSDGTSATVKSTEPANAQSPTQSVTKSPTQPATKSPTQSPIKSATETAPAVKSRSSEPVEATSVTEQKSEPPAPVTVSAFANRSREEALAGWRHLLIDTFFHINGRKYSRAAPGKYWTDSRGVWSGRTGKKGNTQSCVTLPTVSLKRTGIIAPDSGCIWLSSNNGTTPNGTVKHLKESSPLLSISYPHKSLKHLAANGGARYGDILCRSGHTFVYMGKDTDGHPLIYECGSHRDIGNGTGITWGHHAGGHANKLTGKINKQIKKSNAIGDKWRKGKISDGAFKGYRASGKNLNKPVHIVCSINTFAVRTSCTNGTITQGNNYMAGQDVSIRYVPSEGKTLDTIQVDGKKEDAAKYGTGYCFRRISADHCISVVYK